MARGRYFLNEAMHAMKTNISQEVRHEIGTLVRNTARDKLIEEIGEGATSTAKQLINHADNLANSHNQRALGLSRDSNMNLQMFDYSNRSRNRM